MDEFALIAEYFSDIGPQQPALKNTIGDDCAIIDLSDGPAMAVSIDTMVVGVHFPPESTAEQIAWRALSGAVSDLAAMAATPLAFTLALSLPEPDQDWLRGFSQGLRAAAQQFQIRLIGGDTTRGPLTITVQVHGLLSQGCLERKGAAVGDRVLVTGTLGDAALALQCMQQQVELTSQQRDYLWRRFYRPDIRCDFSAAIAALASAAIDLSDGLISDMEHICAASHVAAEIVVDRLPQSSLLQTLCATAQQRYALQLSGGDDYELCLTAAPAQLPAIFAIAGEMNVRLTDIGSVGVGNGLQLVTADGAGFELAGTGYRHFT